MNRRELAAYPTETYSTTGEYLFARYPSFQVFRHYGNRKWITVSLDGTIEDEKIKFLIDMSYELTK